MDINHILKTAVNGGASDIHLKVGLPPIFRVNQALLPLKDGKRLTPDDMSDMVMSIMSESQQIKYNESSEIDFAYGVPGLGRFRINVFHQRGTMGAVFRVIPFKILSPKELNLPPVIEKIASLQRGLILVTGTTGCGKSTTLASIIDYINARRSVHIITIEDPVEFLHRDKRSVINQREVGFDTDSFSTALRSSLRQDPDVILVGEMRDLETIEIAITAAETGHLVLSTLHTIDANETINRIITAFPHNYQSQIRISLSGVLKGVISQRLVPRANGKGRVPAVEVMVSSSRIRECIMDQDKTRNIADAIASGHSNYGMQTFDQSLMSLYRLKLISYEEALKNASNPADFALKLKGVSSTSDLSWDDFDKDNGNDEDEPDEDSFDIERF